MYRIRLRVQAHPSYFYVDNPNGELFAETGQSIKVANGDAEYFIYDEPALDESTFDSYEFHNLRSDITADPDQSAYFSYDNNVTVTDKGCPFDESFVIAGNKETKSNGEIEYIIGPNSSALTEISNTSNVDIKVTYRANYYILPELKRLIEQQHT